MLTSHIKLYINYWLSLLIIIKIMNGNRTETQPGKHAQAYIPATTEELTFLLTTEKREGSEVPY